MKKKRGRKRERPNERAEHRNLEDRHRRVSQGFRPLEPPIPGNVSGLGFVEIRTFTTYSPYEEPISD